MAKKEGVLKRGESVRLMPGNVILKNETRIDLSYKVKMKLARGFEVTVKEADETG